MSAKTAPIVIGERRFFNRCQNSTGFRYSHLWHFLWDLFSLESKGLNCGCPKSALQNRWKPSGFFGTRAPVATPANHAPPNQIHPRTMFTLHTHRNTP
jgi:hypothetical protein